MKEIELRLALVLYGGVSLAIYMHGVSREVLALVRASSAHARARQSAESDPPSHPPAHPSDNPPRPSSPVEVAWEKVFAALSETVELRVVVDAISGASAGGVNGIMLARALAHDLPLTDHRAMWLENADVTRLAKPQDGLTRYFKRTVSPVIDRLVATTLKSQIDDPETREKLRAFVQSRWFTPPFSGERFAGWMLDACARMDSQWRDGATLLPRGHRLDLFVTLTDFHGRRRKILLENPVELEETEHRRILHFQAIHRAGGIDSDMGRENVPDMVFAARATASFPGAFPPATIAEMDGLLAERGDPWPDRERFLRETLGVDPDEAVPPVFVDGSVVMNKPFAPVLDAISDRPAMREVVRRLIYVDPMPEIERRPVDRETVPGFFRIILASLSQIPRNEPIGDELEELESANRKARHLTDLIAATDPLVDREVSAILTREGDDAPTVQRLRACRQLANTQAHRQAGFMHLPYLKLKLAALSNRLTKLIAGLAVEGGDRVLEREMERRIERYLHRLQEDARAEAGTGDDGPVPHTVADFLRGLDVDYRIRRLRFVIRRLNDLYNWPEMQVFDQSSEMMDELKATLYDQIERLSHYWRAESHDQATRLAARQLVACPADDEDLLAHFFGGLTRTMALAEIDRLHDDIFSVMSFAFIAPPLRRRLTGAYIGFAFYDLVTFPVMQHREFTEVNEVLVERISATDPGALSEQPIKLKGAALSLFGAFFNRAWREHDYLWGRLNAADRLLSTVLTAVGERIPATLDQDQLRAGIFEAIVEEEAAHLTADPTLIDSVRERIAARYGSKGLSDPTQDGKPNGGPDSFAASAHPGPELAAHFPDKGETGPISKPEDDGTSATR
ncbi:patatin-related protein [Breoghania corrubedonensis]|uniref:Patatin-related protein n=1 Tax=Breoghania corrubedonensis TaxID=665038 RepID=A0A2T5VCS8_9HYPH|nr:patatin-like protein [Breoghania corrubedonensis]PTW61542.1 patatin-related protein [Breoghania corrubedonensis]